MHILASKLDDNLEQKANYENCIWAIEALTEVINSETIMSSFGEREEIDLTMNCMSVSSASSSEKNIASSPTKSEGLTDDTDEPNQKIGKAITTPVEITPNVNLLNVSSYQ